MKDVVDLVAENNELEKQNYEQRRKHSGRTAMYFGFSMLANLILGWMAFFYYPQESYVWTSNAGAVCQTTPINDPHVATSSVVDFAQDAAVGIYTYDHANYRRQITQTADLHFTSEFRERFMPVFSDSANLKSVLENYYVVSATHIPNKPSQLAEIPPRGWSKPYFWKVQVPLKVSYSAGRRTHDEFVLATVTVVRTSPTRINPKGIAVDYIDTRQLLN